MNNSVIVFDTSAKKGVITIPQEYLDKLTEEIKVILVLKEEKKEITQKKKKRKFTPFLKTKGFKFNRNEANER